MHVHVGVPSPELCMSVMEGVLVELPVLLALSSNSPFWRGKPSGIASTRQAVFAGFPRSGLPPRFGSYEDYAETVGWMETTNVIADYTHLWWDVRPHPRLGTIELRVPDCQFDIDYSLALVAYVQALVMEVLDECEKGSPPVSYHRALLAENKWLAARYGVDAQMMDLAGGRRVKLPGEPARPPPAAPARPVRPRARLQRRPPGHREDPRDRHRRGPPAPGLQREPGPRRGDGRARLGHGARQRQLSPSTSGAG